MSNKAELLKKIKALAERGYKAIGGEALLLGLPLFWYLTETTIRDTVRDFRKGGRRK